MAFTFFDYAVAFIVVASGLVGILRGLVREVLALVGWVVAFVLAYHFGGMAAQWMPESLPGGELTRSALGFLAVFFGTWIVAALAGAILGHNFRSSPFYQDAYAQLRGHGLQPEARGNSWLTGVYRQVVQGKWL